MSSSYHGHTCIIRNSCTQQTTVKDEHSKARPMARAVVVTEDDAVSYTTWKRIQQDNDADLQWV